MVLWGRRVVRSDILLPATHPRRLSRTIRTQGHAIFAHHFHATRVIGMRIERAEKPDTRTQKKHPLGCLVIKRVVSQPPHKV